MTKIINTGKILYFDKDNYLINEAKDTKIQDKWLPAVNDIIDMYTKHDLFKDNIHSIYIRGSVANAQAYDNISDLDLMVVLKDRIRTNKDQITLLLQAKADTFFESIDKHVKAYHPFITKVDHGSGTYIKKILKRKRPKEIMKRFYIKYTSKHVYGENIIDSLPKIHKDDIMMYHTSLILYLQHLNAQPIDIKFHADLMQHAARRMIRSLLGFVYKESNVWTRCLVPCYNLYIDKYPNKKEEFKHVLDIAIFGMKDKTKEDYHKMMNTGKWLTKQIELL